MTRAQFLRSAAGGAAALGAGAFAVSQLAIGDSDGGLPFTAESHRAVMTFHSRPDLRPAALQPAGDSHFTVPHVILGVGAKGGIRPACQRGVMLLDARSGLVWFRPVPAGRTTASVSISRYMGEPVLAWWEGKILPTPGYGQGEAVIIDGSYRELARVRAGNGRRMDLHEFQLTPQATALFTCYPELVPADLSEIGGPRDGRVMESIIQELDIRTGRVLFEWRSLDHIPVTESHRPLQYPYDYLHADSIDVAPDGHLLISGRHTWTLYKIHRRTGQVIWRLGGKRSDFDVESTARFSWQHDARQLSATKISLFDDGADGPLETALQSRAIVLELDAGRRTVRLARAYRHPSHRLLAGAMGSTQVLPNGHVIVGWGTAPYISEFNQDGTLLADLRLPAGLYTYRVRGGVWKAKPTDAPAIAATRDATGARLYASWNGATEIDRWTVLAGKSDTTLEPVGSQARTGFETAIAVPSTGPRFAAVALDASGRELGRSAVT